MAERRFVFAAVLFLAATAAGSFAAVGALQVHDFQVLDIVAGGWTISGITSFATGAPIFLSGPATTGSSKRADMMPRGASRASTATLAGIAARALKVTPTPMTRVAMRRT